jgi:hypothetical protein
MEIMNFPREPRLWRAPPFVSVRVGVHVNVYVDADG